jgi:hypothetical protein
MAPCRVWTGFGLKSTRTKLREAGIILITQLLGLLVRVVGEAMTLQLVTSEILPDFRFLSKSGIPMGFEAILNEVDDLSKASVRVLRDWRSNIRPSQKRFGLSREMS